jgi:2-amino-4-hydroxy-6-hydroxymethyldihydropteridine diphosphokinase
MGSSSGENKSGPRKLEGPILVGLGANLPSPSHGPPSATLAAALGALAARGLEILTRSRWWESAPVPLSDQPWYVNGVIEVGTTLPPELLLDLMHRLEADFGRLRSVPNTPRILDLDLLAYGTLVRPGPDAPLLPHPRMAERAFVLFPLAEIHPHWRHPSTGRTLGELIAGLPAGQIVRPFPHSATSI